MTSAELSKMLWDLSNSITAFAAVQGVLFANACVKKETGDVLNKKWLKLALGVMLALIALGQCGAVEWCRSKLCSLDVSSCQLHTEAAL